ncbi:MAG: histidine kinase dimerization/phospho-acceptor domain-containing protein, partial [Planctomycetota bacterium]
MIDELRTFCLGAAAVLSTALIITLLNRRNRYHVDPIIVVLFGAGWLYHVGVFCHWMLENTTGSWAEPLRVAAMVAMAAGVVVMPSALLHSILRLKFPTNQPPISRHVWLYLPTLVIVPAVAWIAKRPNAHFLDAVAPLVNPFVIWLAIASVCGAGLLFRFRRSYDYPIYRSAAWWIGLSLVGSAILLFVGFGILGRERLVASQTLALFVALPPFLPGIVFTILIIRFGFMRLMVEQTVVYSAIAILVVLFHQVTVDRATEILKQKIGIDFAIVEVGVVAAFALAYRPLRQRLAEALRYLMGTRVELVRDQSQQLTIELAGKQETNPQALLEWFVPRLVDVFKIPFISGWLEGADEPVSAGDYTISTERMHNFHGVMRDHSVDFCNRRNAAVGELLDHLSECEADAAMTTGEPTSEIPQAFFVFGRPPMGPSMSEEQLNAARLLVEHFSVTLQNRALQQKTVEAERQAMQSEKLKTLGMLSSCMAHEVKNPLSTIRTIASVMSEQLGNGSEHAQDLEMIIGEVDRLNSRTTELLGFARPAKAGQACDSIERVIMA